MQLLITLLLFLIPYSLSLHLDSQNNYKTYLFKTWSKYLYGGAQPSALPRQIPPDQWVQVYCEYFDVPQNIARLKFSECDTDKNESLTQEQAQCF